MLLCFAEICVFELWTEPGELFHLPPVFMLKYANHLLAGSFVFNRQISFHLLARTQHAHLQTYCRMCCGDLLLSSFNFCVCGAVCELNEGMKTHTKKKGCYPSIQNKYATAGRGKQDSPHEGFCSPSQTPYSPEGEAEFNVARAEHPVLQKKKKNSKKHTQHSQCLGLTLLNPAPATAYIPSQI